MASVVIVGGGFSGAVTAVNLVRLTDAPLAVTVINSGYPLGRGVAYSTRRAEHLLNVVARNMSALADQPDHFVEWLQTRSEHAEVPAATLRETFAPRRVYGDYLQSLFLWYSHAFADGKKVRIDHLDGEAVDVVPAGERVTVVTAAGQALEAEKVVLATGNQAPGALPGANLDHPRYLRNPWKGWEAGLPDRGEPIVLLGTGLTMIDAFLTLAALGWQGKVFAVSRTGLMPLPHFKGVDYPAFPEGDPSHSSLDRMLDQMQRHCARMREQGINPAILVDRLRPYTQRLWQNFTPAEKRRFLREHRTRWNVTRHRIPEPIHRDLTAAIAAGRLEVVTGSVRAVTADGDRLKVAVRTGGSGERVLDCGAAVNCTGPEEGYTKSAPELYQNLFRRGLVAADELELGIQVAPDFAVLDAQGRRSRHLLALGPPLKGVLWESTAVPELRNQAFRVAEVVIDEVKARRAEVQALAETYADVLEYSI
jgi:uncharacterized NAD(P)/FAD-binding protein YdhS